MTLSKEQKDELTLIVNDPYSYGAFCGMVFNQTFEHTADIEHAIEKALDVRLLTKTLVNEVHR